MKITPEQVRALAHFISEASDSLAKVATFLSALAVEPEQTELPTTSTSNLVASVNLTVPEEQIKVIAKKLVEEVNPPIEHSAEYLVSKRACVEVAPEAPAPKEEPKPEPITRQSLRALAEKLVAKGRLPDVKAALAKHGVTTLSALKPENYAAVQAEFIKNGAL